MEELILYDWEQLKTTSHNLNAFTVSPQMFLTNLKLIKNR